MQAGKSPTFHVAGPRVEQGPEHSAGSIPVSLVKGKRHYYVTTEELARLAGISRVWLFHLRRQGLPVKPLKVKGRLLWPINTVDAVAGVRAAAKGRRHVARRMTTAELAAELKYTKQRLHQLIDELQLKVENRGVQGRDVLWPPKAVNRLRHHRATVGAPPPTVPMPTTSQVAALLGVTQGYVSRLRPQLALPVVRGGGAVYWPHASVARLRSYLEERARPHRRVGSQVARKASKTTKN